MRHARLHHGFGTTDTGPIASEKGTDRADIFYGSNLADRYDGGLGSDLLYGGGGADVLEGSSGKDTLSGGLGNDILRGGSGNDTFVFTSGAEAGTAAGFDRITDFKSGEDKIDVSAFMAGGHFNGTRPLVAGEGPQISYDRAHAMMLGDVNGDGVADFQFYLNQVPVVLATDFIF